MALASLKFFRTMMFICNYFKEGQEDHSLKVSYNNGNVLRYGENPHQEGIFYGNLEETVVKLTGKALSYNNLVDVDAAIHHEKEFENDDPTFCILKHTNPVA